MPKTLTAPPEPLHPDEIPELIETALHAFEADVHYAVLMARAAVTIGRKRKVWQKRRLVPA